MVDFAIVLHPDDGLTSALPLTGRYIDGGVQSFNHTRYGPLTNKPIVVSIETKPEGESLREAEVRLAVWVAAHFTRLRGLLDESMVETTDLPWLPLLIAQGPQWYFLFASRSAAGTTDIWTKIEFGNASTRLGVFKIVSVLPLLFEWSETQYRPWFAKHAPVKV
ncbi:hypothetical protein KCU98_g9376, partial [Aureobasidium melanogenum]